MTTGNGVNNDFPFDGEVDPASPIGVVVGGSLSRGLEIRLHAGAAAEELKVGTFVTVQGQQSRFFGIVTNSFSDFL